MEWKYLIKYLNNGMKFVFHFAPFSSIPLCFVMLHQSKQSLRNEIVDWILWKISSTRENKYYKIELHLSCWNWAEHILTKSIYKVRQVSHLYKCLSKVYLSNVGLEFFPIHSHVQHYLARCVYINYWWEVDLLSKVLSIQCKT